MVMQINQELCAGCGDCITACPENAIYLVNQRAVIDGSLCSQCKACVEACPNEAIAVLSVDSPDASIVALPVAESRPVPVPEQAALLGKPAPARSLAPWAGTALAFLGREIVPRLAEALVTALERRLTRPAIANTTPSSASSTRIAAHGGGERRRVRYRRGRAE